MARTRILKSNGKATPFFWSDTDGTDPARKTVYKVTEEGIKRMKGVHFNVASNEMRKD